MALSDVVAAFEAISPIALFVIGVAAYALFIFKFYRFIAKRDILSLNLAQYASSQYPALERLVHTFLFILEYVIVMPLCIFCWFIVLTGLLAFLAKNRDPQSLLLIALALVGAVRIVAYYKETLAQDLAKTVPLALLAVYLADASYVNIGASLHLLRTLPGMWRLILWYLGFVVLLEFALRILSLLFPRPQEEIRET
jgi:hypothetical protein